VDKDAEYSVLMPNKRKIANAICSFVARPPYNEKGNVMNSEKKILIHHNFKNSYIFAAD
jgi:hypothetical protein